MKKTFEIFGKKVPLIAILIALLVIGTASAAVFVNYATLSGTHEIPGTSITVYDSNSNPIDPDDLGDLNFSSSASFSINNSDGSALIVYLETNLTAEDTEGNPVDTEGITVECIGTDVLFVNDSVSGNDASYTVLVPAMFGDDEGESVISVDVSFAPNIMEGNCTITVQVNPTGPLYP